MNDRKIPVIVGPTAVGKTEYAIRLAQALGGEIVSADSMQIYRFMDIGSAKPTAEERAAARHHLVDEIDPRTPFSAAEYSEMAKRCIGDIIERDRLPIVSGGTGLYVNALIYDMDFSRSPKDEALRRRCQEIAETMGNERLHRMLSELDPEAAARIHPNNVKKVIRAIEAAENGERIPSFENSFRPAKDYRYILLGLDRSRQELYDRINRRVDLMVDAGLEEEIRSLLDMGLTADDISMKGIGYKEMIDWLSGRCSRQEAVELIKRNSRRYAKRQMTWFRRYPDIRWFTLSEDPQSPDRFGEMLEYLEENGVGRREEKENP